jgi:hypothetical protein
MVKILKSLMKSMGMMSLKDMEGEMVNKWIGKIKMKKGALHKMLGVSQGKTIPKAKLMKAATKGGLLGKRARLAMTLGKMNKG